MAVEARTMKGTDRAGPQVPEGSWFKVGLAGVVSMRMGNYIWHSLWDEYYP